MEGILGIGKNLLNNHYQSLIEWNQSTPWR